MAKTQNKTGGKTPPNDHIQDITHEAVVMDGEGKTVVPIILSPDEQIKNEIAKFNVTNAGISALKKKYGKLTIAGVEDKEGYKILYAAWQDVREKRILVEKKHKEIKADYLAVSKGIDAEKNRIIELIEPLESQLYDEWKRIEALKEAAKEEEARKDAEKLANRVNTLTVHGMAFNGSYYAIGEDITMDVVTLKEMPEETFEALLERVKKVKAAIDEAEEKRKEAEAAEKKKQEEEREAQRLENIRLQEERESMQREREKMEEDKRKLIADRTKSRGEMLEAAGLVYNWSKKTWETRVGDDIISFDNFDLDNMDGTSFTELYEQARNKIHLTKAAYLEAKEAEDKLKAEKDAEEKKLRDEKEAQEALQAKINKAREERFNGRKLLLFEYNFKLTHEGDFVRTFPLTQYTIEYPSVTISDMSDEKWNEFFELTIELLKDAVAAEKEARKIADEKAEEERKALLSEQQLAIEYLEKIRAIDRPKGVFAETFFVELWTALDELEIQVVD